MPVIFACTYAEKIATVDHFETGCEVKSNCIFSQRCYTFAVEKRTVEPLTVEDFEGVKSHN